MTPRPLKPWCNGIGYSIRTRRYRYTEWWRTKTSDQDSKGNYTDCDQKLFDSPEMIELYDYQTDPNETVNLAQDPAHSFHCHRACGATRRRIGLGHSSGCPHRKAILCSGSQWWNRWNRLRIGYFRTWKAKGDFRNPRTGILLQDLEWRRRKRTFSPSTTVLMDQNRTVTATFSPITHTLTVSDVVGGSASGSGIFSHGFLV